MRHVDRLAHANQVQELIYHDWGKLIRNYDVFSDTSSVVELVWIVLVVTNPRKAQSSVFFGS